MSSDPTTPATDPQQPVDELAGKLKRTELQRSASSIPGREIVQVLTEIPAGVESGWHIHPVEPSIHEGPVREPPRAAWRPGRHGHDRSPAGAQQPVAHVIRAHVRGRRRRTSSASSKSHCSPSGSAGSRMWLWLGSSASARV